jgi:hypothetical protein
MRKPLDLKISVVKRNGPKSPQGTCVGHLSLRQSLCLASTSLSRGKRWLGDHIAILYVQPIHSFYFGGINVNLCSFTSALN